jgi:hypothetical protein
MSEGGQARFSYSLVTDGPSDQALLAVLDWLLRYHTARPFEGQWVDLRNLPNPPKGLPNQIKIALDLYPCTLLFVHRDAEREPRAKRVAEIRAALAEQEAAPATICVIPVRMQEAWFLFDEAALRKAAGRPTATNPLAMPKLSHIEDEPDPKRLLHDLLRKASGLDGRHSRRFRPVERVHRLAQLIEDFSPLLQLSAFKALNDEVRDAAARLV